jgi:ATP-dependent Clp protease ATP-binding subunit ClpC
VNGFNFTERLRKVLGLARDLARARNHEYVGTEHLLLGLVEEGEGVAAAAIEALGVELPKLAERIDGVIKRGSSTVEAVDLPYTSRTKRVLELAIASARDLHHDYVGSEHLLLGLIREQHGIAAQVLSEAGLTTEDLLREIQQLLGFPPQDGSIYPDGSGISGTAASYGIDTRWASHITAINVEVTLVDGSVVRERFSRIAPAVAFLHRQNRGLKDRGNAPEG